ncbi:MAG: winged helix-turn-helix transcriptional regulator [Fischerella sp.]|jgi:DNA-binding HxlR family transcriptional regulator|uniref:winged helix-turn-helix transcriptional regulator n=1 Tax=Fischerella sp. TaxID=1191 RepID=UPI0018363669|nr:winged helix-turn-helix transcriptional regulator [Fischerella sp.]NWF60933.1 winged helix-turn-helix transcriptional regulator [Fischerella sp.]
MTRCPLRELENDGIISRKIYPEIPPKVEYSLTDLGKMLEPTLLSLESWGIKYIETQPKNALLEVP